VDVAHHSTEFFILYFYHREQGRSGRGQQFIDGWGKKNSTHPVSQVQNNHMHTDWFD